MGLSCNTASRFAALLVSAGLALAPLAATAAPTPRRTVPITVPLSHAPAWSVADETAENHRWRRYRHRDGIDGGDLVGGLLILGGVAAVAAAISKDKQERRGAPVDEGDYRYRGDTADYGDEADSSPDYGRSDARETDRAVDACTAEAARNGRVDEIFDVEKIDGEWRVRGDYVGGGDFACTVDGNGRAYVGNGDDGDWNARDR